MTKCVNNRVCKRTPRQTYSCRELSKHEFSVLDYKYTRHISLVLFLVKPQWRLYPTTTTLSHSTTAAGRGKAWQHHHFHDTTAAARDYYGGRGSNTLHGINSRRRGRAIGRLGGSRGRGKDPGPVSYTHLDVYKRQVYAQHIKIVNQ